MPINLLAISVGNTRTQFGTFVDGDLDGHDSVDNKRFTILTDRLRQAFEPIAKRPDAVVMLASVSPGAAERVEDFARTNLGGNFLRAERDIAVPIGRQLDPEAIVGEDRLLNAAAAFDVLQQACIVVDAGTAITVDFIDGAGTFHGGAIAPGGVMQLNALHHSTAALPEATFAKPHEPVGHNTIEAMRSGVYYGLRGLVRELIDRFAEQAGLYPMIVATGGDADLLFRGDELIDRIAPHLPLMGMAVTLKKAVEAEG